MKILLIILQLACIHGLSVDEAVGRFFNYFEVDDPTGIPVINFDEPMELLTPLKMIPVVLINGTLLGHSDLSFITVVVDLLNQKAELKIRDPRLEIGGIYSWPGFFTTSVGTMNATIINPEIYINVTMFVNENHALQISDFQLFMDNDELFLNMTNLVWEHELIMATGSVHIFFSDIVQESVRQLKPLFLDEANRQLQKFVSNMPPAREKDTTKPSIKSFVQRLMNYLGLEPLNLPNQQSKILGVKFKVTNMVLHGMSVVTEVKSLFMFYHDQEFYFEYEMVYPKLLLFYTLGLSSGSYLNFNLYEKNQLNNVNVRIKLIVDPSQKKPPVIKDLHVYVESFGKIRSGKSPSFFEIVRNFFLDVADDVRNQIIGALTGPIKNMIQNELNKMDLKEVILFLANRNDG